jgi:hypothetical protein
MPSEHIPRRLRQWTGDRACWRCEYCLSPAAFSTQPFAVDHVIPRSRGGRSALENLALSCGCNGYKGDRTHARDPKTRRVVPLFHPRRQRWARHFAWTEDLLRIRGRTAVGRATVRALRLNRPELVNLRRVLMAIHEHPPAGERPR